MRFFVFQLFLVSLLLSVTGCQQENPEITKLWDDHAALDLEINDFTDSGRLLKNLERIEPLVERQRIIVEKIVEIDPDALYVGGPNDGKKIADLQEQRIKRLKDASDKFDRDMGN